MQLRHISFWFVGTLVLAGCGNSSGLIGATDVELHFTRCDCSDFGWQDNTGERTWSDCAGDNAALVDSLLQSIEGGQTVAFSVPSGYETGMFTTWALDPDGPDEYSTPQYDESGNYTEHSLERVDIKINKVETFVSNCDGANQSVFTLVVSWNGQSARLPF